MSSKPSIATSALSLSFLALEEKCCMYVVTGSVQNTSSSLLTASHLCKEMSSSGTKLGLYQASPSLGKVSSFPMMGTW